MSRKSEIHVVGVHALPITRQLVDFQFQLLYDFPMSEAQRSKARKQCRTQLKSVALIETQIKRPDDHFCVNDFTQVQPGLPRESWQAPYLVRYLDAEGLILLEYDDGKAPRRDHFRCAFYLHFFQDGKPLITSYGERFCPHRSSMPDRLKRLVPFEPVD